jgi:hypothetical protein
MMYSLLARSCESRGLELEIDDSGSQIKIYTYEGLDRSLKGEELKMEIEILKCFGKKKLVLSSWVQDPELDCRSIISCLEYSFPILS